VKPVTLNKQRTLSPLENVESGRCPADPAKEMSRTVKGVGSFTVGRSMLASGAGKTCGAALSATSEGFEQAESNSPKKSATTYEKKDTRRGRYRFTPRILGIFVGHNPEQN